MSNDTNTRLIERAKEAQDYWVGTLWEKIIQQMIDSNDLDGLWEVLKQSDREIFQREYNPDEATPVDVVKPVVLNNKDIF